MKLTRGKKIALAAATVWPPIYMVGFMAFVIVMIATSFAHGSAGKGVPTGFLVIFVLHVLTILWIFGLLAVYLIHVLQNDKLDKDKRTLWAILIFVGSMVAMPIYFYQYILPLQDDAGS